MIKNKFKNVALVPPVLPIPPVSPDSAPSVFPTAISSIGVVHPGKSFSHLKVQLRLKKYDDGIVELVHDVDSDGVVRTIDTQKEINDNIVHCFDMKNFDGKSGLPDDVAQGVYADIRLLQKHSALLADDAEKSKDIINKVNAEIERLNKLRSQKVDKPADVVKDVVKDDVKESENKDEIK